MSARVETIGAATLYLGDCREVLPTLGKVDAVVTDPPYGIDFHGKATKHTTRIDTYSTYEDTEANFEAIVVPAVRAALGLADRGAVFCASNRAFRLPTPDDIGGIYAPAGAGMSAWGFKCFHAVMLYGVSPYLAKSMGSRPTATSISHPGGHVTGEQKIDHPCPKPVSYMEWLVTTVSLPGHLILDPFMGSGTTGVACARLGRRFVGIEIEPKYFDIACRRIEQAQKQADLFVTQPAPARAVQEAML